MISAAAHQVIFFAIAFSNTSCTFIIRSISAAEYRWASSTPQPYPPPLLRTHHVLIRPDNSHTNDNRMPIPFDTGALLSYTRGARLSGENHAKTPAIPCRRVASKRGTTIQPAVHRSGAIRLLPREFSI